MQMDDYLSTLSVIQYILVIPMTVGMWKVFLKVKEPGWASIIPIYNLYILLKVVGRPWWWLVVSLIPIGGVYVYGNVSLDLAKSFGRGVWFGALLFFLPFVGYPVLGFGKSQYIGPSVIKVNK